MEWTWDGGLHTAEPPFPAPFPGGPGSLWTIAEPKPSFAMEHFQEPHCCFLRLDGVEGHDIRLGPLCTKTQMDPDPTSHRIAAPSPVNMPLGGLLLGRAQRLSFVSSIIRWARLWHETGSAHRSRHGGGRGGLVMSAELKPGEVCLFA